MARKSWYLLHRSCWVGPEISTLRTSPRMKVLLVWIPIRDWSAQKAQMNLVLICFWVDRAVLAELKFLQMCLSILLSRFFLCFREQNEWKRDFFYIALHVASALKCYITYLTIQIYNFACIHVIGWSQCQCWNHRLQFKRRIW